MAGFEPATSALSGRRSNHLSYMPIFEQHSRIELECSHRQCDIITIILMLHCAPSRSRTDKLKSPHPKCGRFSNLRTEAFWRRGQIRTDGFMVLQTIPMDLSSTRPFFCGSCRIRTYDFLVVSEALWTSWVKEPLVNYHTNHSFLYSVYYLCMRGWGWLHHRRIVFVRRDGIEPPTRGSSGPCSTYWATAASNLTSIMLGLIRYMGFALT